MEQKSNPVESVSHNSSSEIQRGRGWISYLLRHMELRAVAKSPAKRSDGLGEGIDICGTFILTLGLNSQFPEMSTGITMNLHLKGF